VGNPFNTTTKLLAGSLLVLSPAFADAAGLGKLSVLSALGQPLKAEIDVVALEKGELDSLTARIPEPEAFARAGVEYSSVAAQIRAVVERRGDGRAVISLKTQQPVDEPFVDVLVELDSANGRLVRQYTFLLDPVGYKGPEPAVASPTVVAQPAPAAEAPAATPITPEPAPAAAAAAPAPAAAPAAESAAEQTYQVKAGDTLSRIAEAHRPQDVTLQQMLVALQRANEDAFINRNMNLLRVGKILRIPSAEEVSAIEQAEAVRIVRTQTREFAEYRAKLAAQVAASAPSGDEGQQQVSGRITAQVQEQAPAGAAPRDELRLSRAADGDGQASAVATADDLAAQEKALREANERIAELERNLSDLQRLLELKNQQLAQLQQQAQGASAEPATTPAVEKSVTEAPAPQAEDAQAAAPAESAEAQPQPAAADKPAEQQASEQAPAAAEAAAEPAVPVAKSEPKPAPKPAPKKQAPAKPKPEPTFLDMLLEEPLMLAGGGGAVLALLLGLLVYRRRRASAADNSLVGLTTTDTSSVFGTTGGRNIDTGASSLQTDFSHSALGSIDTEEVDPVAEADVYMAYGRDAQAEEILKEALQKDPSRLAVRMKLLEIYAARKDLKAFETTANEIHAATGGQGPDWEKVVTLGRSIDPNNRLYGAQPAAESAAVAAAPAEASVPGFAAAVSAPESPAAEQQPAPLLDLDLGGDAASAAAPEPDLKLEPAAAPALDLDLDLNLGGPEEKAPEGPSDFSQSGTLILDGASAAAGGSQSLDIDLGAPTLEPQDKPAELDMSIDFKLDEPALDASTSEAAPKADVPAIDFSGLSLDLDADSGQSGDSTWQEVATKLDLAKAYEEMGDKDGARELLNEVLKEGDEAQKAQARSMLDAIG